MADLRNAPRREPDVHSISQAHVDELASQKRQIETSANVARQQCREIRWRRSIVMFRVTYLALAAALRRFSDSWFGWRPATSLIIGTLVGAVAFVGFMSWPNGVVWFIVALIGSACLLHLPPDDKTVSNLNRLREESQMLKGSHADATKDLRGLQTELTKVSIRLHQRQELLRQRQSRESQEYRRRQLLKRDWKALRSVPFESFLEEVFSALGYVVETTKITGDQGADLIVAKNGHRIAIQVKGYFHSVSNSAVQEAHAAKDYYNCEACAVITNSRFTSGAKNLASGIGCILIDEDNLPSLIMGHTDLLELRNTQ